MGIFRKEGNKWYEYKYISDNGEEAVKNMYTRESHDSKGRYQREGIWKDKNGVIHKVKLTKIKQL